MKKQRGQSAVEFALIAPIIFLMIFGMIWGGYMFMEYLRFSNDVRTAARNVAVADSSKREALETQYQQDLLAMYEKELPDLYKPTIEVTHDTSDAIVTVTFTRRGDLPKILVWMDFPPANIPALKYKMKLE